MPANKETVKVPAREPEYDFVDCVKLEKTVNSRKIRDRTAVENAITQMQKAIGAQNQHGSDSMDRLAIDAARFNIGLTIRHIVSDPDGVVWDHSKHKNVTLIVE